jgi:antitoxin HigA-1
MPTFKAVRNPDRCPSHPGAVLSDILDDFKMPKAEISQRLGISRQHLYDILAERKSLSPNVAALIGKMFGGGIGTLISPRTSIQLSDGGRFLLFHSVQSSCSKTSISEKLPSFVTKTSFKLKAWLAIIKSSGAIILPRLSRSARVVP